MNILQEFSEQNNNKPQTEVEFKVFWCVDFKKLQKAILQKLNWKVIFNGIISDIRYYDTLDKKESQLNKTWIYLVRLREEKSKNNRTSKLTFTIKKENWKNNALEYEKEVSEKFKEKLIKEYNLKEIKKLQKTRKEIEFEVELNWKKEKVKIAFDNYIDKDNKEIPEFFEVEWNSVEIIKKWWEELKKLWIFDEKNLFFTTKWPRKIKEQLQNDELLNFLKQKNFSWIKEQIKQTIIDILKSESIFVSLESIFKENKENKNFSFYDNLKEKFKDYLIQEIEKKVNEKDLIWRYFYRILSNEDLNKNSRKKLYDKFEREYTWYIKAFFEVIIEDYKKNNWKYKNKKRYIEYLISSKLDIFLKSLFIFDDSLVKDELQEILNKDRKEIKEKYEEFETNIFKILNFWNLPKIWPEENINDSKLTEKQKYRLKIRKILEWWVHWRTLNRLITTYARSWAYSFYKKWKFWDKEVIKEKLEQIEQEQSEYLARQFSLWLNSPDRSIEKLETIKSLFLENLFQTYVLANSSLAFEEYQNYKFDKNLLGQIISKYDKILFSKDNFQVKEIGPWLFKYFIENIFDDTSKIASQIEKNFLKYNENYNKKLLKIDYKDNISELNHNQIDFYLWQKLRISPRLYLFYNKVLDIKKEWIWIKNNFLNKKLKKDFIEYEFKKISFTYKKLLNLEKKWLSNTEDYQKIKTQYDKELKIYEKLINFQLNNLTKYFKNNSIWNKNNIEKIQYLLENDINSFQLLVSYFQFNLKSKVQGKNIEQLSLYSDIFAENVLNSLDLNYLIKENIEFFTSTSQAYTTSNLTKKRIIELHDRIWNDKSINVWKNFYFEINWQKFLLKDFSVLYLKKDYKKAREFLLSWIETTRWLLNDDETKINKDYLDILKSINFPINDKISLKKLLEFQKFVYKIIMPYINNFIKQSNDVTNNFANKLYKVIQKNTINDYKIASPKWFDRTLEKIISKYWWNIEKISDLTRATIFGKNDEDLKDKLVNFVNIIIKNFEIKSIRFEDKIWNLFKKAKRINWYRDATLVITDKNWNTIEIQFQLDLYYKIKTGDIDVSSDKKVIIENKEFDILSRVKRELNIRKNSNIFSKDEKEIIINYIRKTWKKIPKNFVLLLNFDVEEEFIWWKFNADFTYNLERSLWEINPKIKEKLFAIDKELFNIANGILAWEKFKKIIKSYDK